MKSLAANLSTPFLERFALAREAGFLWVECQFPYEASAAAVGLVMKRAGVRLVLLNLPADGVSAQAAWRTLMDNIRFAADALSTHGGGLRILPPKTHALVAPKPVWLG
ncbi:MAG: hydroxypyruvate isomerase [Pseudomonadota bacterium]